MDRALQMEVRETAMDLLEKSGFPISEEEIGKLTLNDFGLGDFKKEGFTFIDILRSPRLRITLIVLLPNQTLPQHTHPPYDDEPGKEETIRVIYGQTRVYTPGAQNNADVLIPEGKEIYYTVMHETLLNPGEQCVVHPPIEHWFQGGPEGSVNICFQNRVDETKNIFLDPKSEGCPVPLTAV